MVQEVIVFVLFFAFCFLEHLAVFFIEALVELLTCSRPAVVAPQPIGWLLSDGVLEASHICLGDAILAKFFRMAGDEFHLADIVSSPWSRHLTVENSLIHALHYAVGACKHGCVMAEEWHPEVHVVPQWLLIGNISHDKRLPLVAVFYYVAQCLVHRQTH